jgi:hypothetical protein
VDCPFGYGILGSGFFLMKSSSESSASSKFFLATGAFFTYFGFYYFFFLMKSVSSSSSSNRFFFFSAGFAIAIFWGAGAVFTYFTYGFTSTASTFIYFGDPKGFFCV